MSIIDYYDRQGQVISEEEFFRLRRLPVYKRVAETTLEDGTWISTVWMGMDHGFGEGPPLIFETKIFRSKEGPLEEIACSRYWTEQEAWSGHARMVDRYRRGEFAA